MTQVNMRQPTLAICLCFLAVSATSSAQFDEESQIQTLASHTSEVQELGTTTLANMLLELEKRQDEAKSMLSQIKMSSDTGKVADINITEVAETTYKLSPLADLLQESVRDDLKQALIDVVNTSRTTSITQALRTVGERFSKDIFGKNDKLAGDLLKKSNLPEHHLGFFLSTGINWNLWNTFAWLFDFILPKGFIARMTGSVNMKLTYMNAEGKNAFCMGLKLDQTAYGVERVFKDWSFAVGPVNYYYRPGTTVGVRFNTNSNLIPKIIRDYQQFMDLEFALTIPLHFASAAFEACMPGIAGCDPRPVEEDVPWTRLIQDVHPIVSHYECVELTR